VPEAPCDDGLVQAQRAAFVTGGSGFIGGRLVRRLTDAGWSVRALARSERSAERVRERGAEAVSGDLDDVAGLRAGATGCELAFHAAARLGEWGDPRDFERVNVGGTRNALSACAAAGVRRFVHVGTEAALMAGQPLIGVDEHAPLRFDSPALYAATKARAEEAVITAAVPGFETVVVRPRFVWGAGDTTILPALVEAVRSRRFAWIGGGRHLTSTTHVDNVVEGLMLGAERGITANAYFVTDGAPVVFRDFVSDLLATRGVEPPTRSLSPRIARALAAVGEAAWRSLPLPGQPPITRFTYWLMSMETTIDIAKAREQLGYRPVRSIAEGLEELRREGDDAAVGAPAGGVGGSSPSATLDRP
jgi:nucleoside-diphosphate-sugar epimerase